MLSDYILSFYTGKIRRLRHMIIELAHNYFLVNKLCYFSTLLPVIYGWCVTFLCCILFLLTLKLADNLNFIYSYDLIFPLSQAIAL